MSTSSPPPQSPSNSPPIPPLTLIVATTPSLGIGHNGSLPWPPLKPDLQFFARVTKRPPPASSSSSPSQSHDKTSRNAVVTGRKTYASIPPKFRPLKGRHNIVITRSPAQFYAASQLKEEPAASDAQGTGQEKEKLIAASSIADGLQQLQQTSSVPLGRVFVIGGAEIYRHALGMRECERVLWTRLSGEWECDTFFPEGVVGDGVEEGGEVKDGWRRTTRREMEEWVGEEGVGGLRREGDVEFEVMMWERVSR